ncbi:hypothetical protein F8M41_022200 [Gigaspora margarita]|uniref:Uncharacterized protein n=1 Tax=Gigaspora margarita TaxID=4874 RepID=A0A8H4AFG6_GIGMA|nr:hypothetical protein F8M41_022200 [Gigaspora margarita]
MVNRELNTVKYGVDKENLEINGSSDNITPTEELDLNEINIGENDISDFYPLSDVESDFNEANLHKSHPSHFGIIRIGVKPFLKQNIKMTLMQKWNLLDILWWFANNIFNTASAFHGKHKNETLLGSSMIHPILSTSCIQPTVLHIFLVKFI